MRSPCTAVTLAVVLVVGLCACDDSDSEKKSRGLRFMPEMYNTPAYKSQQAMRLIALDGKSPEEAGAMMSPPPGTVARDGAPYDIPLADIAAAKALINPLLPEADVLRAGQHGFATFCAVCHGLDGNASNGFVAATKEFPKRLSGAPSLTGTSVAMMTDGEIYHIVSLGRNRMPNYRAQLPSRTRWAVVTYLRLLNRATLAVSDAQVQLAKLESDYAEGGAKATVPEAKAELEQARHVVEQRTRDLALIKQGGSGSEFDPPQPAVPEYVTPKWPEK